MAQLFKPVTNTIARASLLAGAAVPFIIMFAGSAISQSNYNTKQGVNLDQPVPFSHQHHVQELGIDCRFCHTSVEKSATAGIPSTDTCMMCHSQIWTDSPLLEPVRTSFATGKQIKWSTDDEPGWNKVAKVPEFVFFNHSIHVNRGISCNECHGAIQKMPLTNKGKPFFMKWCLDCHRNPEKVLYKDPEHPEMSSKQQVFNLYRKFQAGDKLTPREYAISNGQTYTPTEAEKKHAGEMIKTFNIKKATLEDCSICHR